MNVNISPYYVRLSVIPSSRNENIRMPIHAYLFTTGEEELIRIHAIRNSASNEGKPVKHNWRFIAIVEEQLVEHIQNDGNKDDPNCIAGDAGDLADDKRSKNLHDAFQRVTTQRIGMRT
jgi:hypothetical protein